MESYKVLYRLRIRHDYFTGSCKALGCRLSPRGEALAWQRRWRFEEMSDDEWVLLCNASDTSCDDNADLLELELFIRDPMFAIYTEWKDFHLAEAYALELPLTKVEVDAAQIISRKEGKRSIGSGFCILTLRIDTAMKQAMRKDEPVTNTLCFSAPKRCWEYIFISRSGQDCPESTLVLENTRHAEMFQLTPCEAYGRKGGTALIETPVPMCESYDYKLRLVQTDSGNRKRILLSEVPPPEPGRFHTKRKDALRQVCYY